MRGATDRESADSRRFLLVSLLLHVAIGAFAVLLVHTSGRERPAERPVRVDILTADQFAALAPRAGEPARPAPPPQAPPETPPETPAETPKPAPPGMVRAQVMLSEATLADPRSRAARAALPGLSDDERMVQLCNVEAMDQVHAWRQALNPDRLVAYAMEDLRAAGPELIAEGAAIRIGGGWYNMKFRCELSPDGWKVVAFAFRLGGPIPEAVWEDHGLEAAGGDLEHHD